MIRARPRRLRGGFVLAGVVMAMVAMALAAHGALLLARFEVASSHASFSLLEARVAAESGLIETAARALPAGDTGPVDGDGGWSWGSDHPGGGFEAEVRPLDSELRLAQVVGWDRRRRVSVRSAGLMWRLDPVARVEAAGGVVEVGSDASVTGMEKIDATGWNARPSGVTASVCPPLGSIPAPLDRSVGSPTGLPGLGLMDGPSLGAFLESFESPRVTPASVRRGGVCVPGLTNWGDPAGPPASPCGGRFVALMRQGDLRLDAGSGQGLLVVDGDLELSGGAHFAGVVLLSGRLVVTEGAIFEGYVRASGGALVEDGQVIGSACRAVRALRFAGSRFPSIPVPGWGRLGPIR